MSGSAITQNKTFISEYRLLNHVSSPIANPSEDSFHKLEQSPQLDNSSQNFKQATFEP